MVSKFNSTEGNNEFVATVAVDHLNNKNTEHSPDSMAPAFSGSLQELKIFQTGFSAWRSQETLTMHLDQMAGEDAGLVNPI